MLEALLLMATCFAQDDPKPVLPVIHTTIVITAQAPEEPSVDRRNAEVFSRTLFTRDDQIFHVLDAGINAGRAHAPPVARDFALHRGRVGLGGVGVGELHAHDGRAPVTAEAPT